jgi:hypothetical protein
MRSPSSAQRSYRRSCSLRLVWHPVDLAPPDHTPARGQPSTGPPRALSGSAPGLACGSPLGGRWDATPCLPTPAAVVVVGGHPGDLPRPARAWFAVPGPAQRRAGLPLQFGGVSAFLDLGSSTRRCNTGSHVVDKGSGNNEKGIIR